ncbi:unnamed protein product [Arctia plantaginis]|uniref:Uncharacterized protein n=1 Tax=Arctia plantaginis TaxID=874455 RepID=A0A8S1B4N4_ARCPL|nr:unnamed protein product [Arctia plantaginis]
MSNVDIDNDGFQKVKSKRLSKNKPTRIPPKAIQFDKRDVVVEVEKVFQRIQSAVEDLRVSNYLGGFLNTV